MSADGLHRFLGHATRALLVALVSVQLLSCWEEPQPPDVSAEVLAVPCDPEGALSPFFLEVQRVHGDDPTEEIRLSGLATVIDEGAVSDGDSPYARELRLRFITDARDVVVRHRSFLDAASAADTGFIATSGESVNAVVWRLPRADELPTVYVALRGMDGLSRGFLCRGERCEAPAGLCPGGFDCPVLAFQDSDCEALDGHACGPQIYPPVGIGSAGADPDLVLGQGEYEAIPGAGTTWVLFVAYATAWPEAETACPGGPAAQIAGGILPEL